MTYKAVRLPERIAFGAQGGPMFLTVVSPQESRDESREATVDFGLGRWVIGYQGKREDAWSEFQDFFYIVGGRRDSWAFKDWLDYVCTTAESHLEPDDDDSPVTQYQMYKRRTLGAYTYDQKIVLPRSGFVTVNGGGTYSVSYTTGIITHTAGPVPTSFSCEFDKLCRFDADHLIQTIDDKNIASDEFIVNYSGIPVIEIPLTSA